MRKLFFCDIGLFLDGFKAVFWNRTPIFFFFVFSSVEVICIWTHNISFKNIPVLISAVCVYYRSLLLVTFFRANEQPLNIYLLAVDVYLSPQPSVQVGWGDLLWLYWSGGKVAIFELIAGVDTIRSAIVTPARKRG